MTPVKIIALVFVVFAFVKVVVIFLNPSFWKSVVKSLYAKPPYTILVSVLLAAVILRFLLEEMTIVQIFACMAFMMALMIVQFVSFGNEIAELCERFLNDRKIFKKLWFSLSIWLVLMAWALYEILV